MTEPTVLIFEDDAATATAMAGGLAQAGLSAAQADRLDAAISLLAAHPIRVAVLDRMLPEGDGIAWIDRLRAARPGLRILVVSALGRAANRIDGLDRGADDYLAKPFEPDELIARIRALMRRDDAAPEDGLMTFNDLQIRLKARTVHTGDTHIPLSPREFDLLVFFARNHGVPVSRMQLLEHVWNLHFDPQTNVVDVHVGRLRRKLEAAHGASVIHTLRGQGYLFDPSSPDGAA